MIPERLYKYRGDNSYTEKIITDGNVWLSTAKDLNDPLECQTGIVPQDFKRKIILEREQAQLSGMMLTVIAGGEPKLFSLNRRQTKRWFAKLNKAHHTEKMRLMRKLYRDHGMSFSDPTKLFEAFEEQLASVGIFSLSADDNNQLMWAHYSESHKGLAFGFDVCEGSQLANPEHLLKVTYSEEKPKLSSSGAMMQVVFKADGSSGVKSESRFSFQDPVFRSSVSTKPTDWEYEREWRYVHERAGAHPCPGKLASVTFGLRMRFERKLHYANLARSHGLSLELLEVIQTEEGKLEVQSAILD